MYAVNNFNMTVPMGAIYGFIGENGSGKSTTEKLICGLLVPDNGQIKLFGKDYKDAGIRVRVGALIENAGCFPGSSVWNNLMMQAINLGLENAEEEIKRVLKIVRMENCANLKFKSCSLGMKQRIGIARALYKDIDVLLLDEATSALDNQTEKEVNETLSQLKRTYEQLTILSIAHRESSLAYCDRIITLEKEDE